MPTLHGRHWKAFRQLKEEHPDTYQAFIDHMYQGGYGWGTYQVCTRLYEYTGIHVEHPRISEITRRYPRKEFPV